MSLPQCVLKVGNPPIFGGERTLQYEKVSREPLVGIISDPSPCQFRMILTHLTCYVSLSNIICITLNTVNSSLSILSGKNRQQFEEERKYEKGLNVESISGSMTWRHGWGM